MESKKLPAVDKSNCIIVKGADTIYRISPHAVVLQTSNASGIELPEVHNGKLTIPLQDLRAIALNMDTNVTAMTSSQVENKSNNKNEASGAGIMSDPGKNGAVKFDPDSMRISDRIVTEEDLKLLSRQLINKEWRSLGLQQMDISTTELETLSSQNATVETAIFQMLRLWQIRLKSDATVSKLIDLLKNTVDDNEVQFLFAGTGSGAKTTGHNSLEHRISLTPATKGVHQPLVEEQEVCTSLEMLTLPPTDDAPAVAEGLVDYEPTTKNNRSKGFSTGDENATEIAQEPEIKSVTEQEALNIEDHTMDDIERLRAVYAGFAEDKKEDFTSMAPAFGDILQNLLKIDHENKRSRLEIKQMKTKQDATKMTHDDETTKKYKNNNDTDMKLQRSLYLKVKGHLTEAISANKEWERYTREQREKYERELATKAAVITSLKQKVNMLETSSSEDHQQLNSILNAAVSQAGTTQKDYDNVKVENTKLRETVQRLSEENKKIKKMAIALMPHAQNGQHGEMQSNEFHSTQECNPRAVPTAVAEISNDFERMQAEIQQESPDPVSYKHLMEMVKLQAKPPPKMVPYEHQGQTSPSSGRKNPPKVKRHTAKAATVSTAIATNDDIEFLKAQILQYREDFECERRERQRAAGELDSLRDELKNTKLVLNRQKTDLTKKTYANGNYDALPEKKNARRDTGKVKGQFRYMGPEEVEVYREDISPADRDNVYVVQTTSKPRRRDVHVDRRPPRNKQYRELDY